MVILQCYYTCFQFIIVYLPKKSGNWKMAQDCRLSSLPIIFERTRLTSSYQSSQDFPFQYQLRCSDRTYMSGDQEVWPMCEWNQMHFVRAPYQCSTKKNHAAEAGRLAMGNFVGNGPRPRGRKHNDRWPIAESANAYCMVVNRVQSRFWHSEVQFFH